MDKSQFREVHVSGLFLLMRVAYIKNSGCFYMQSSYYIDRSSVLYTAGQVLTLERNTYQNLPCAYGSDTGGCRTLQVLQYLHRNFGPVSSFTGSYRADSWTLDITRQNTSGEFLY